MMQARKVPGDLVAREVGPSSANMEVEKVEENAVL